MGLLLVLRERMGIITGLMYGPGPSLWHFLLAGALAAASQETLALVLVRPDGWARGEREGYGEPCDVTSLSLARAIYSIYCVLYASGPT